MQPTLQQLIKTYILACSLTRFYRSIELVRLDGRTRFVVILAGAEIEIEIYPDGSWSF
ncbi:DUF6888 family protein [Gloeobacter morelensis]|uniref:DUF6888 domain-containing protein n=1 Tax=Gloeobacter morelensis MG652769 TaxID=2781736 RepID=A0ABY3PJV0_9CYAN|nr:hypothetical protein [Gloeobacter morelensis]UFP93922.1 hypothetical protein ISF26_19460 [Gloeobacter morelensis MG652769]